MIPKVINSAGSKFHHFDLARQLSRKGLLECFYTGYPRWRARREGVAPDKLIVVPSWEIYQLFNIAVARTGWKAVWFDRLMAHIASEMQDRYLARKIRPCDVFIGLSGSCARTATTVQNRGGLFICDRGSSHIRTQDQLLREEHARWNIPFQGVDPRRIRKEEKEYLIADAITISSKFSRRSYVEQGLDPAKVHRIPYGVDLSRFQKVDAPQQGRFDVLFVGQVSLRKGVPYLLQAFEKLKHPAKSLRIVGGMQPCMQKWLGSHGTPEGVEFLGNIPQVKLKELFSRSHVMVLPSIEDGFGLVMGQAMACGCPVIATTNTGAEDLFEDGREGCIIPIRDPETLAMRMLMLAEDSSLRARFSEAALQRVGSLGGWDTYGDQFEALIFDLLEKKGIRENVKVG